VAGPVLVIGGSGRTGRQIVDRLRRDSVAVRVLSRHGGDLDAAVVVAAFGSARARGKTLEIYNQPGAPPEDWDAAFAGLTRD
jgi:uncharacterized protein YbjT (DUF2867 family)